MFAGQDEDMVRAVSEQNVTRCTHAWGKICVPRSSCLTQKQAVKSVVNLLLTCLGFRHLEDCLVLRTVCFCGQTHVLICDNLALPHMLFCVPVKNTLQTRVQASALLGDSP